LGDVFVRALRRFYREGAMSDTVAGIDVHKKVVTVVVDGCAHAGQDLLTFHRGLMPEYPPMA
jgi:hypothetical protein